MSLCALCGVREVFGHFLGQIFLNLSSVRKGSFACFCWLSGRRLRAMGKWGDFWVGRKIWLASEGKGGSVSPSNSDEDW